jgi:hypothetical protein
VTGLDTLRAMDPGAFAGWLRGAVWSGRSSPIPLPRDARVGLVVARAIDADPELVARVRGALPTLVRQVGARDPLRVVEELLVLASRLRCAAAAGPLADLLARLPRMRGGAALEQRTLAVLAGLDPEGRALDPFRARLHLPETAPLAFRALYRHSWREGARALPSTVAALEERPAHRAPTMDFLVRHLTGEEAGRRPDVAPLARFLDCVLDEVADAALAACLAALGEGGLRVVADDNRDLGVELVRGGGGPRRGQHPAKARREHDGCDLRRDRRPRGRRHRAHAAAPPRGRRVRSPVRGGRLGRGRSR